MSPISHRDPRAAGLASDAAIEPGKAVTISQQPQQPAGEQEGKPTYEELMARVEQLESQASFPRKLGIRVSPKGGVSIYGIRANFPMTFYADEVFTLDSYFPEIKQFIEANKDLLDFRADDEDTLIAKAERRKMLNIVPRSNFRTTRIETSTLEKKAA